jgi:hypothetical protein
VNLFRGGDISGQVHELYHRWFGNDYDCGALFCMLCAAAAERLGGDPAWMLLVGGPGAAKTETIMPLVGAGAVAISTINGEAALLSGTSKKDRAKDATGGLLRKIGPSGVLVIKDVTSILSMNRDTRALVLAALREVYDGSWSRNVGTDGGQTLTWRGRLVVVGAVTTAWDAAHSVVSAMGDRFVLVRLDSREHRGAAGRRAMGNVNHETVMRAELAKAVGSLLDRVHSAADITATDEEINVLIGVADLVTRARTAVERDFQGNPQFAHDLEMPTRFAKQLVQIVRGGVALGLPRDVAMAAAMRAAGDSIPPRRLSVLSDVSENARSLTSDVAKRLQLPRKTVDRVLQELQLLGLLTVDDEPWGPHSTRWVYTLAVGVDEHTIKSLTARKEGQKCHLPLEDVTSNLARNVSRGDGRAAS